MCVQPNWEKNMPLISVLNVKTKEKRLICLSSLGFRFHLSTSLNGHYRGGWEEVGLGLRGGGEGFKCGHFFFLFFFFFFFFFFCPREINPCNAFVVWRKERNKRGKKTSKQLNSLFVLYIHVYSPTCIYMHIHIYKSIYRVRVCV